MGLLVSRVTRPRSPPSRTFVSRHTVRHGLVRDVQQHAVDMEAHEAACATWEPRVFAHGLTVLEVAQGPCPGRETQWNAWVQADLHLLLAYVHWQLGTVPNGMRGLRLYLQARPRLSSVVSLHWSDMKSLCPVHAPEDVSAFAEAVLTDPLWQTWLGDFQSVCPHVTVTAYLVTDPLRRPRCTWSIDITGYIR